MLERVELNSVFSIDRVPRSHTNPIGSPGQNLSHN